jgi:hypothetical protein
MTGKIDWTKISQAKPTPKEAIEGSEAYVQGLLQTNNPYPKDTRAYTDWDWGWQEGENYEHYMKEEDGATK